MANNHTRRAEPPMSARQGALVIKHLERMNARAKKADRAAKVQRDQIIKCLHRICDLLEKRGAA